MCSASMFVNISYIDNLLLFINVNSFMSLNHIDQQVATKARRLTLAAIHGAEGRMALLIVTESSLSRGLLNWVRSFASPITSD